MQRLADVIDLLSEALDAMPVNTKLQSRLGAAIAELRRGELSLPWVDPDNTARRGDQPITDLLVVGTPAGREPEDRYRLELPIGDEDAPPVSPAVRPLPPEASPVVPVRLFADITALAGPTFSGAVTGHFDLAMPAPPAIGTLVRVGPGENEFEMRVTGVSYGADSGLYVCETVSDELVVHDRAELLDLLKELRAIGWEFMPNEVVDHTIDALYPLTEDEVDDIDDDIDDDDED